MAPLRLSPATASPCPLVASFESPLVDSMEEAPVACAAFGLTDLHLEVLAGKRGHCTLTLADRGLRLTSEDFQTIAAHLATNTNVLKLVYGFLAWLSAAA